MNKGSTPLIAVILSMLITVGVAGVAFFGLNAHFETRNASTETSLDTGVGKVSSEVNNISEEKAVELEKWKWKVISITLLGLAAIFAIRKFGVLYIRAKYGIRETNSLLDKIKNWLKANIK